MRRLWPKSAPRPCVRFWWASITWIASASSWPGAKFPRPAARAKWSFRSPIKMPPRPYNAFFIASSAAPAAPLVGGEARALEAAEASPARRRGKLLYKLLPLFLSLSLIPLLLVGYLLIRVAEDRIQIESRGVKLEIAQKVGANVAAYIQDLRNILSVVHKSSDFLAMHPRRQSDILSNVMNAY